MIVKECIAPKQYSDNFNLNWLKRFKSLLGKKGFQSEGDGSWTGPLGTLKLQDSDLAYIVTLHLTASTEDQKTRELIKEIEEGVAEIQDLTKGGITVDLSQAAKEAIIATGIAVGAIASMKAAAGLQDVQAQRHAVQTVGKDISDITGKSASHAKIVATDKLVGQLSERGLDVTEKMVDKAFAVGVKTAEKAAAETAKQAAAEAAQQAAGDAIDTGKNLMDAAKSAGTSVKTGAKVVGTGIKKGATAVGTNIAKGQSAIKTGVDTLSTNVGDFASHAIERGMAQSQGFAEVVKNVDLAKAGASGIAEGATQVGKDALAEGQKLATGAIKSVTESSAMTTAADGINKALHLAGNAKVKGSDIAAVGAVAGGSVIVSLIRNSKHSLPTLDTANGERTVLRVKAKRNAEDMVKFMNTLAGHMGDGTLSASPDIPGSGLIVSNFSKTCRLGFHGAIDDNGFLEIQLWQQKGLGETRTESQLPGQGKSQYKLGIGFLEAMITHWGSIPKFRNKIAEAEISGDVNLDKGFISSSADVREVV